ncbi:MAG: YDG domain-containing protein [Ilumatobacteraceae bacterium]
MGNDNWSNAYSVCTSPQLSIANNCTFTADVTSDATTESGESWQATVWYRFVAGSSATVYIRATSGFDNTLHLRDSSGTILTRNDDSYGLDAAISYGLSAGSTYYVGVGAYSSGRGSVSVSLTMSTPDPPTNVIATVSGVSGTANVSWTSADLSSRSITSFSVDVWLNGSYSSSRTVTGTPPSTSATIGGLTNGSTYKFCIKATNSVGTSACSSFSNDVVPYTQQTVSFPTISTKSYGDAPFTISATSNAPGAAISFASTTPLVCSVTDQTVSVLAQGTCSITATGGAVTGWSQNTATNNFTVNRKTLTISGVTAESRPYADSGTVAVLGTGLLNGLVSGDESLVILGGTPVGTVSNRNVGTQSVTVSGFSISGTKSGNYTLTQPAGVTVSIGQKSVNVSGSRAYTGSGVVAASDLTVATGVVGQSLTLSGTGSITNPNAGSGKVLDVTGLTLGNGTGGLATNYTLTGGTHTFTVIGANQSAFTLSSATTGGTIGQTIALTTSGGSGGGAITFSSGSSTACTVNSNGVVTITSGTGTCSITATKDGDAGFNPAASNSLSIAISKAAQSPVTISGATTGDYGTTISLTRSGGSGTGPVTWSNGSSTACTVNSNGVVTITSGTGTCSITATKATDDDYLVDTSSAHVITVAKIAQSPVTVAGNTSGTFGNTVNLNASGGTLTSTITWSNGSSTACTVNSNGIVTITSGTGTCSITATRPGNDDYNSRTSASHTITVSRAPQSPLSITGPASALFGQTIALSTTGGDGAGAITWSNGSSTACTVNSNGVVTITSGTGTCSITATKTQTDDHDSVASNTYMLSVDRASQSITIPNPGPVRVGGTSPTLVVTGAQTSPVTWSTSTPAICSVDSSNGVLTPIAVGDCDVTATVPSSAQFGSSSWGRTIVVGAGELAIPSAVSIASVTATSITARVTPVTNATSYAVRLYRGSSLLVTVDLAAITVATDVSFSSLDPESTYRVTVTALSNSANWLQSAESQPVVATTDAIPVPASRVFSLVDGSPEPRLVSESDSAVIERQPGDAAAIVDGVLTDLIRTVVDDPAAQVPPDERTPEQVAAIQASAQAMLQLLVDALPDDATVSIEIRNTTTGAEVFGLVADPDDGSMVSVPIENVVLLTGQGAGALIAAVDSNLDPTSSITGGLVVLPSGFIAVKAWGFSAGSLGEIVFFSTPRKLAEFTANAEGAVIGQVQVPSDIGLGDHTFVMATEETKLTAGVSVRAAGALPRTGDEETVLLPLALAFFALGGIFVVYRRRPDESLFGHR